MKKIGNIIPAIQKQIGKKGRPIRREAGLDSWDLFFTGDSFYSSLFESIRKAKKRVWIEVYILGKDPVGERFLSLLEDVGRSGIDTRLLVDGVGSWWMGQAERTRLERAGIHFQIFRPLKPGILLFSGVNRRNHRKLMIVDDVCYLGGMNLSCSHSVQCAGKDAWSDTMLRLEGPIVPRLEKSFLRIWEAVRGGGKVRQLIRRSHHWRKKEEPFQILEGIPAGHRIRSRLYYLRLMRRVHHRVLIRSAYFVPGPVLVHRLKRMVKKGLDVRILLNEKTDVPVARYAGRALYTTLLKSGVRIYEKVGNFSHAKVTVLDGKYLLIGSSNLDYRSFLHNLEIDLFLKHRSMARRLEGEFFTELEHAREMTLDEFRKRPGRERFLEWFFYLFRYWL